MFNTIFFYVWNWIGSYVNPKLVACALVLAIFLTCAGVSYYYGYKNASRAFEQAYSKALEAEIDRVKKEMQEAFKAEKELIEKKKEIEIQYVDRIEVIEKIVEKTKYLNAKECAIPKVDVKEFNKSLGKK